MMYYHYTCKGGGAVSDDMHAEQTITNSGGMDAKKKRPRENLRLSS